MKEDNLKGHYAGFVSRLIAFGIDVAIVTISLLLMGWLLSAVLSLFNVGSLSGSARISAIFLSSTFGLLYTAAYFIFLWTLASQTLGKTIMGLRIVTTGGEHLTLGRSVRRLLGYIVSIFAFFVGFLWILFDDRRQGWHDKIAGTLVIYAWDAHYGGLLFDAHRQRQEISNQ